MKNELREVGETRRFQDISIGELIGELIKMLDRLGIAGSTADYNLYKAVQDEHAKVCEAPKYTKKQIMDELNKLY